MIIATLLVAIAATVAAAAAWHEARRGRFEATRPPGLAGRAVLVSTRGDTAVRGIVQADLQDRVTLRDAVVITVGRDAEAPARGLLHVYHDWIDYIQDPQETPAPATQTA